MAVTADQVYGDSQWLRENPGLIQKFSSILTNYGIVPDAGTLAKYGLSSLFDPSTSAAATNNPYSIAALLKNHLSGSLTNNATAASARNGLFSGAFQNSQDQAGRDYQQSYAQAGQNELSSLFGVQGAQTNLYNTIFGRLMAAPVAADPTVYPPEVAPVAGPAPGVATGYGTGYPTPQGPYQRTGSEAGWTPPKSSKKKTSGIVGGLGFGNVT